MTRVASPMPWLALRFAVAELQALARMAAEREQAERDAEVMKALARRRCTVRLSRWLASEQAVWRRHEALQRSLRALRRETRNESTVRHVGRAIDCPACQPGARAQSAPPVRLQRTGHVTIPQMRARPGE